MKKALLTAGAILTILGLAILGYVFYATGFDLSKLSTVKYETNTYAADGAFRDIEICTDVANVTLKPSDDGKCRVVCVEPEKAKHTVTVENGTLKITESTKNLAWYEQIGILTASPSVTVYLPETAYDALAIESDTGRITLPGGFSFESVSLRSDTGDVEIGAVRAGVLSVTVSTGRVRASDAVCQGDLSVTVSTGKTELTNVRCANLTSRGDTGPITLKDVVAEGRMYVERDTGSVRFDNSDAAEITVKTDTGSVTGTLRTAKVFVARSDLGSVRVPDTTSGGRCEITTDTGSVRIELSGQ